MCVKMQQYLLYIHTYICMGECINLKPFKYLNANILNNRNLNILLGEISQGFIHTYTSEKRTQISKQYNPNFF